MKNITTPILQGKVKFLLICFFIMGLGAFEASKACVCAAPGDVTISAGSGATATSFNGNWTAPTTPCGAITNYTIDVSTSATFTSSVSGYPKNTGSTGTSYTATGLACNTTYYYRVKGITCGGSSVNWSNVISVTTAACPSGPCYDGVQNNGETGIDCGGPCALACPTCFDGIQNGTETGIDCGGSCAMSCTVQPTTTSTTACPGTAQSDIYPVTCAQVGTSAFDLTSGPVEFVSGTAPAPTPAPGCGAGGGGSWARFDLNGVDKVSVAYQTLTSQSAASTVYQAFYQGTGCGSLSLLSCGPASTFSMGSFLIYNQQVSGLNAAQDLYVYTFGASYDLTFQLVGTSTPPANDACGGSVSSPTGCNVGAGGDTWTTPGAASVSCTGGNWGSNENTVWYTVTATATTGSIDVANVVCNDGTAGNAQFAVFTSCACAGNYTAACFKGCAVATGSISLTGLTAGTTYYVAVDGFAGDMCKWDFITTNLLLPVTYIDFDGKKNGNDVNLNWSTSSESNVDYYVVERTTDGENFISVGNVAARENADEVSYYNLVDYDLTANKYYYRLKEYDKNGSFAYSKIISVDLNVDASEPVVYYDPSSGNLITELDIKDGGQYSMNIFNALGQMVAQNEFSGAQGNKISTDMKSSTQGIYIVNLVDQNSGKKYTMKIVK